MRLGSAMVNTSDYESAGLSLMRTVGTQLTQLFILPNGLVDK